MVVGGSTTERTGASPGLRAGPSEPCASRQRAESTYMHLGSRLAEAGGDAA